MSSDRRAISRVLMTVDSVGGVWRYAMDLADALKARGMAVVFAGFGPAPSRSQVEEAERIGTLRWLDAALDWMADDRQGLAEVPDRLAALAEETGADILHLNLPSQAARLDVSVPVVAVSHSCVVTWFAGVRGTPVPDGWRWQRDLNLDGLSRADAIVAPSRSHAAMLEDVYGRLPNLRVVHNASRVLATTSDKTEIVFAAGRWWDDGKNGAVLDAAAPAMRWPLIMAGPVEGPGGQALALENADHRGALSHRQTMELMTRASIVVSPSLYEPFGLAALEAARSGAALVLSDIPTYRELWSGAALFANADDPEAFSHAVNRLIETPALRRELGQKAQDQARAFSPAAQADAMLGIYREAASRRFMTRTAAE
jgi:glycosyltransferase involved in cell wall biosynthesis